MTFSRVPAGLHSSNGRLWLAVLGVVLAVAAAITAIIKFEVPSHGGPVHAMQTPARIGSFTRAAGMESVTNLAGLRTGVIQMSAGQASNVKSAVYESGNSAAGNTVQIIMFTGGHLAGAAPATSITGFTQKFAGPPSSAPAPWAVRRPAPRRGPPRRARCPCASGSTTTASGRSSRRR